MANEEPLVVVKTGVDVVREVVRKDCGDSRDSVVREGEVSLCRGRCGSIRQRTLGAEDGYISRGWGFCVHWGSEVFALGGSDEDIIGIDGDILVERGEEESVKDLLGDSRRSGRHGGWGRDV